MTLNRWQRLGIVVSILWILISGSSKLNEQEKRAQMLAGITLDQCLLQPGIHPAKCFSERDSNLTVLRKTDWYGVCLDVLLPVPVFWILAWISVRTFRWVVAGKR